MAALPKLMEPTMGLFVKLRSALKAASPTAADLQKAIADAGALADTAAADRARLAGQRADMLVASDGERAKWKAALADADERKADAAAFTDALTKRLVLVEQAEDQVRRNEVYTRAKAQAAAASTSVRKEFNSAAAKLLGALKTLAEAQIAVAAANDRLPAGADPIADPERSLRPDQYLPRATVRESEVELWCHADGTVVGESFQSSVQRQENGTGARGLDANLMRRGFRRIEFHPPHYGTPMPPLASGLRLPGIYEPPTFMQWSAPSQFLELLRNAEAALTAKPIVAVRPIEVEFVPVATGGPLAKRNEVVDVHGRSRMAAQPRQAARGGRR